jgi:hypothetical protein
MRRTYRKELSGWQMVIVVVLMVPLLGLVVWLASLQDDQITDWAESHGYEVVEIKRVGLFEDIGPFRFRGKNQSIYRTVLRDRQEHERVMYHRSGFWWEHVWEDGEKVE